MADTEMRCELNERMLNTCMYAHICMHVCMHVIMYASKYVCMYVLRMQRMSAYALLFTLMFMYVCTYARL